MKTIGLLLNPVAGIGGPAGLKGSDGAEIQEKATALIRRHTFREAASVIANRETGVIAVRATARQHAKLSEFLEKVLLNARRQVLIEATVVEVALNDQSQTGVDWKSIALGAGFSVRQNLLGSVLDSGLDTAKLALLSSIMGRKTSSAYRLWSAWGSAMPMAISLAAPTPAECATAIVTVAAIFR